MFNSRSIAKRIAILVALSTVLSFTIGVAVQAQANDRQRAIELYEANNFAGALPLLEKVAAANPNDVGILSRLGFVLFASVRSTTDSLARQQLWDRARSTLMRARSLGDDSNLTRAVLEVLQAKSPTDVSFSSIKEADAAVREGEAAFVHGELDKAIAAYQRALALDPHLYNAALFAGDAEFKKGLNSTDPRYRSDHFDQAGVWFAKAIAIDPDRETAYRYWGDALEAKGQSDQALIKFVEAIIADPYNRGVYDGIAQWAERHKVPVGHPRIAPPNSTTTQGQTTTLTVDPRTLNSSDGSSNWLLYNLIRMNWEKSEFFKNYPDEKVYRHSLKEEAAALRMVAEAASKDLKTGKVNALEASLDSLVQLNDAGLLEAFVLFARPDQGIARDYVPYRAANRDKLKRYWLEVAIIR